MVEFFHRRLQRTAWAAPTNNRRRRLPPRSVPPELFFQDTWKTAPSLTLTLGLRYENFGQPVNSLRYPAFRGFDPNLFFQPNRVNTDNLDFGPAFGFAWAPSLASGWLGNHQTVWRGGYQISYDPLYTQAVKPAYRKVASLGRLRSYTGEGAMAAGHASRHSTSSIQGVIYQYR